MRHYLKIMGAVAAFVLLGGCTTAQEIRTTNGEPQYDIACGAATGWGMCYKRANEECPQGYTTVSRMPGFNRKELIISCGAVSSPTGS